MRRIAGAAREYPQVDVALCVPTILIERAARAVPDLAIGAQDVHHAPKGAHTGCVSAEMLLDAGASLTIVGHSERRDAHRETDDEVKSKAAAALSCGLNVILCVGESLEVREHGGAVKTVVDQLGASLPDSIDGESELAIAYEPIWAIGTGKVPTTAEIAEMHGAIRERLRRSLRLGRGAGAHFVRRLGQAVERGGDLRYRGRGRSAGGRSEPQSGRLHPDRGCGGKHALKRADADR